MKKIKRIVRNIKGDDILPAWFLGNSVSGCYQIHMAMTIYEDINQDQLQTGITP